MHTFKDKQPIPTNPDIHIHAAMQSVTSEDKTDLTYTERGFMQFG